MDRSLRFRITAFFTLAIASVFVILLLFNNFGLIRYYTNQKTIEIQNAYELIDECVAGRDTEGLRDILEKYSDKYNISIALVDSVTNMAIVSSERGGEALLARMQSLLFGNVGDDRVRTLIKNNNYTINLLDYGKGQSGTVECFGYCSDNTTMVLMSTSIENLRESVKIANRFILITGIIILFFESVAVFAFADRVQMFINRLQETNVQLRSDLEKKEKQEKLHRAFIANVSHELKTPIALIQGYAEGLQDGMCEDEESRKYYSEVIVDEAGKMNELVKQLLELSSIESGEELDKSDFSLSAMVSSLADSVKILADQKNAALEKDITDDIIVNADERKIESVVMNYLNNAIHHVTEGGVIRVSLVRDKKKAVCRVFNTGNPIPQEDIKNIWNKFYKVDKAHTRSYGGSGIGLSIVKAVMEAHGGAYGVKNKEDGVEFFFEIKTHDVKSLQKERRV